MLTVAYCRVSTEEQAAEGFSIAGQADKLPHTTPSCTTSAA